MPSQPDLRRKTHRLVELVHTVSGYPLVVETDRTVDTTASVRMRRGPVGFHTIRYNPSLAPEPDYNVAVLCGQLLRFFAPPPSERVDLAGLSQRGLYAVRHMVQPETGRRIWQGESRWMMSTP